MQRAASVAAFSFFARTGQRARRWLPRHVAIHVPGRSFLGTGIRVWVARSLGSALATAPIGADAGIAHVLLSLTEAGTTGAVAALLVAQRPDVLATYSDRLHLPTGVARR